MAGLRQVLHRWTVMSLLLQVASLGALLPRDCCQAHEHDTRRASSCHEATAALQCPMRGPDGTACPMHRDAAERSDAGSDDCALRGACNGPMSGLVALLSQVGLLPVPIPAPLDTGDTSVVLAVVLEPNRPGTPPDSPPPRG